MAGDDRSPRRAHASQPPPRAIRVGRARLIGVARACYRSRMSSRFTLLFFLAACGGRSAIEPHAEPAGPSAAAPTFVMDRSSCTTGITPSAQAATTLDDGDELAVAEIHFVEECTGAGGTWVLGRDVHSHRRFFLGEHGCRLWESPPAGQYGVVRHRQTAALFLTPEGVCVAFPGDERLQTDQSTSGFVVFATRAEAESFATERGWKRQ